MERTERLFEEKRSVYAAFLKSTSKYTISVAKADDNSVEWEVFEEVLSATALLSLYAPPELLDKAYDLVGSLQKAENGGKERKITVKALARDMHADLFNELSYFNQGQDKSRSARPKS